MSTTATMTAEGKGLVLHHLNRSRSQRILWLLEELGLEYTIRYYERGSDQLAPPELNKVHPLGKSPVLTDGDLVINESGAIIEYLLNNYGKGRFPPPPGKGTVDNAIYTHYAEGSLMPLLAYRCIMTLWPSRVPAAAKSTVETVLNPIISAFFDPAIKKHVSLLEEHLNRTPNLWLAGGTEPTSADFLMCFAVERILIRMPQVVSGDVLERYIKQVHERPAFKKGIEKGGEYDYKPKVGVHDK